MHCELQGELQEREWEKPWEKVHISSMVSEYFSYSALGNSRAGGRGP